VSIQAIGCHGRYLAGHDQTLRGQEAVNIPKSQEMYQAVLDTLDDGLRAEMIQIVMDLINIPSPTGEEMRASDYVYNAFASLGLKMSRQEVESNRNNVIAVWKGTGGGKTLLFNAHFDTSMTGKEEELPEGQKPNARLIDGWIYGLGASNMKNAFATYYGAIKMIQKAGLHLKGDVIMGGVVGEIEKAPVDQYQGTTYRGGGLGSAHMMKHGVTSDFCIDGEPTGLRLQPGCEGLIFCKVTTFGQAQHTWSKEQGVDAIEKMVSVMDAIRRWEPAFEKSHTHPLMKTRVGIGAIQGGYPFKPSFCPSPFCSLYIDIRTLPGQKATDVKNELNAVLKAVQEKDRDLRYALDFFLVRDGYEISLDHLLNRVLARNHHEITGMDVVYPEPYRYAVSADTSIFHEYGIPGITYGAGGITREGKYSMYDDQGECVGVDNLLTVAKVNALCAVDLCELD
jgi:acetylornithine deacetylase/succinyl-diaminopimelate desuccinylase-like protein